MISLVRLLRRVPLLVVTLSRCTVRQAKIKVVGSRLLVVSAPSKAQSCGWAFPFSTYSAGAT